MNTLGLRTKLILAIAVPVAIIAGFLAIYVPNTQATQAETALEVRATSVASLIGRLIEPFLATRSEGLEQALAAASGDPDLRYASVVATDGTVKARYRAPNYDGASERGGGGVSTISLGQADGLMHVSIPLVSPADKIGIGALHVGFDTASIESARDRSTQTALFVSAMILAIGVLIAFFSSGTLAKPLLKMSDDLSSLSEDLVSAARAREASAAEEAAAVEQTRRTMDMLLSSAQKIADSASVVLGNAERTLDGSRQIADRIRELNRHAEKVTEILATIMQIADRTDLLALNAAIEGTKAGEAGKGFGLVAREMRRLAENVMESVAGIRRLMKDVRDSSQSAVDASSQGMNFSEETTSSVREIALVTQQQRKATEQVSRSMDDMTELLNHAMVDIKQTTRSASALSELADRLAELINAAKREAGAKKKR